MPRVLILGYGKMGRIHARHLSELGVEWDYSDPSLAGGASLESLDRFTHAVVATPIPTHYDVYRQLDRFAGRVLIEKPVVVRPEHLHVLNDPRVFPGMCERFNPVVEALKSRVAPREILSIDFCRASLTGDVADVGIHDLDLCCHLLELREAPELLWETGRLIASARGVESRFSWPLSNERQRTIVLTTSAGKTVADLSARTIDGIEVSGEWPVKRELAAFLSGSRLDARLAHELLVRATAASHGFV